MALTVLVSTLARKVRQAVLIAYVLMLGWQFVPVIVGLFGSRLYPATYGWIEPVNDWVGATSPLCVYVIDDDRGLGGLVGGARRPGVLEQFAWMVGLQLGGGGADDPAGGLAAPADVPPPRGHASPGGRGSRGGRARKARARRRWWDRPECGDDAMGWKERHFARTDVFTRLVVLPATVLVSVFLVLAVGIDESILRAFADLWRQGFRGWGRRRGPGRAPPGLLGLVRRDLAPGGRRGLGVVA